MAQLYIGFPGKSVERPLKLLRGFERLPLAPAETRTVEFFVPDADLAYWSESGRAWALEPGPHMVMAGGSSVDEDLLSVSVEI